MEKKYEFTNEEIVYEGHTLHRIRALKDFGYVKKGDLGGFVEESINLSQQNTCWIYDSAKVYGNSNVSGSAIIYGNAVICSGSCILDNAIVKDNACISSSTIVMRAQISDDAKVLIRSYIAGDAIVTDTAVVENSNITGRTSIGSNATVLCSNIYGNAKIRDCAVVARASLSGDAIITGDSVIPGGNITAAAKIHSGLIRSALDYFVVGPIGSRDDYTTFYKGYNDSIRVKCGCFYGTLDEFEDAVKETHVSNPLYLSEYLTMAEIARNRFKLEDDKTPQPKKYELTDETLEHEGHTLHRIRALKNFGDVKKGDLGGFVECESNLSQIGKCWVYDQAMVYLNGKVLDYAKVKDHAEICSSVIQDYAIVQNDAVVQRSSLVRDRSMISNYARVSNGAQICDISCIKNNAHVSGHRVSICGDSIISGNVCLNYANPWESYMDLRNARLKNNTDVYINHTPLDSFADAINQILAVYMGAHNELYCIVEIVESDRYVSRRGHKTSISVPKFMRLLNNPESVPQGEATRLLSIIQEAEDYFKERNKNDGGYENGKEIRINE